MPWHGTNTQIFFRRLSLGATTQQNTTNLQSTSTVWWSYVLDIFLCLPSDVFLVLGRHWLCSRGLPVELTTNEQPWFPPCQAEQPQHTKCKQSIAMPSHETKTDSFFHPVSLGTTTQQYTTNRQSKIYKQCLVGLCIYDRFWIELNWRCGYFSLKSIFHSFFYLSVGRLVGRSINGWGRGFFVSIETRNPNSSILSEQFNSNLVNPSYLRHGTSFDNFWSAWPAPLGNPAHYCLILRQDHRSHVNLLLLWDLSSIESG
jgi:hypothetical protein